MPWRDHRCDMRTTGSCYLAKAQRTSGRTLYPEQDAMQNQRAYKGNERQASRPTANIRGIHMMLQRGSAETQADVLRADRSRRPQSQVGRGGWRWQPPPHQGGISSSI